MEIGAGVAHILHLVRSVEPIEDIFQFPGMTRLNTALTSIIEEGFETLVSEAD